MPEILMVCNTCRGSGDCRACDSQGLVHESGARLTIEDLVALRHGRARSSFSEDMATHQGALNMHYALEHGLIQNTPRGGPLSPFRNQCDFVTNGLGFVESYGTLLKRLARALTVWEIQPGTQEWKFLVQEQTTYVARLIAQNPTLTNQRTLRRLAAKRARM